MWSGWEIKTFRAVFSILLADLKGQSQVLENKSELVIVSDVNVKQFEHVIRNSLFLSAGFSSSEVFVDSSVSIDPLVSIKSPSVY